MTTTWETVIGLEVHAQLKTNSKIFSGAPIAFGAEPNTQACPVDLGLPGVLPVLNKEVVMMAIKFGLGTSSKIAPISVFARKNYFYPDLPKGYQISQYELPIVHDGFLDIPTENHETKRIRINRAHLEEDAGKSLHEDFHGMTGVDLNRAGTPLLEIVSEPDMRSAEEAITYLKLLHSLVRYLDICDGNMQEGSFRCDANVSVRPKGQKEFGTRTEIKNLNSFRFIERAINYEVKRQIDALEHGESIVQQTMLFDENKNKTRPMRSKEEANDYRYFPDPDLKPLAVTEKMIDEVRSSLPELPQQKAKRFVEDHGLTTYDANVLIADKALAYYFEQTLNHTSSDSKTVANWVLGELLGALNKQNLSISESPVTPEQFGKLLSRISDNTISGKIAKSVFEAMFNGEGDADVIIEKKGLKQITDTSAIESIVNEIIENNASQVEAYRGGKDKLFGFFVGQAMKQSGGKINPKALNEILKQKLDQ